MSRRRIYRVDQQGSTGWTPCLSARNVTFPEALGYARARLEHYPCPDLRIVDVTDRDLEVVQEFTGNAVAEEDYGKIATFTVREADDGENIAVTTTMHRSIKGGEFMPILAETVRGLLQTMGQIGEQCGLSKEQVYQKAFPEAAEDKSIEAPGTAKQIKSDFFQ